MQSQNVQLQIRFHLFKIDGLVAQIANLIKMDTPNRILPPSEIERRDTALTREVKILESLVGSVCRCVHPVYPTSLFHVLLKRTILSLKDTVPHTYVRTYVCTTGGTNGL